MRFHTALCDVLGIEYPIIQSGMGSVAGPDLAAEVSRAGGLGVVGGLNQPPDELRKRIRYVRERTDRPFGVNLWLHTELRPPVDPKAIPPATVAAVQSTLNRFRARLEIPAATAAPRPAPDLVDAGLEVILEERVPVFSAAIGVPGADMVARCHDRGVKVLSMVATVQDARDAAANRVDAIVAQGGEAGGHRSVAAKPANPEVAMVGTMALVPQIVDVVRVPVVAAGGLAEGVPAKPGLGGRSGAQVPGPGRHSYGRGHHRQGRGGRRRAGAGPACERPPGPGRQHHLSA